MVSYIKTGKSLFGGENSDKVSEYHIPVFKEVNLRNNL